MAGCPGSWKFRAKPHAAQTLIFVHIVAAVLVVDVSCDHCQALSALRPASDYSLIREEPRHQCSLFSFMFPPKHLEASNHTQRLNT
jgi:hypothetical protein